MVNTPERVKPDLRARAEAVLAEAGYVPHGAARSLASRRSRIIGAVVPTVDSGLFARIVDGLQQRLHPEGYQLLLASSAYSLAREHTEVRALLERGIDGLLLVGRAHDPGTLALLRSRGLPFAACCYHDPEAGWPTLGWDNALSAERLANYLLDLGHRRFGVIAGLTADNDRAAERLVGFQRALRRRGVPLPASAVIERPYTVAEARQAMAVLMRQANPPTAVMCGNDILAYGALQECLWQGIPVPGQVSITGFDDIEMAAHCKPGITTLRVPAFEMGERAAAILLEALAKPGPADHLGHVSYDLQLIVRGTTGLPPAEKSGGAGRSRRAASASPRARA